VPWRRAPSSCRPTLTRARRTRPPARRRCRRSTPARRRSPASSSARASTPSTPRSGCAPAAPSWRACTPCSPSAGYPTEVHAALDELFARDLAGREVARFADGSPVIERVGCDEVAAVLGEEAPTTLLGFGPIFSCSPGDQLAQVRAENAAWSRYVTRGDRAALAALDDGAAILATLDGKVTP
jgi:hypothetical protein